MELGPEPWAGREVREVGVRKGSAGAPPLASHVDGAHRLGERVPRRCVRRGAERCGRGARAPLFSLVPKRSGNEEILSSIGVCEAFHRGKRGLHSRKQGLRSRQEALRSREQACRTGDANEIAASQVAHEIRFVAVGHTVVAP